MRHENRETRHFVPDIAPDPELTAILRGLDGAAGATDVTALERRIVRAAAAPLAARRASRRWWQHTASWAWPLAPLAAAASIAAVVVLERLPAGTPSRGDAAQHVVSDVIYDVVAGSRDARALVATAIGPGTPDGLLTAALGH